MIPKSIIREHFKIFEWAILIAYRGSITQGLYVPQEKDGIDDKDIMMVCIPDIDYYFGLLRFGSRGTQEIKQGEWDIVCYEFQKFINLLKTGNPNVLSILWLEKDCYIEISPLAQAILDNRNLFVSKQVYHHFTGYAYGQLHRMTHQAYERYMGKKRKQLVNRFGYDTKNACHLIRLLKMCIEFLVEGRLYVKRQDSQQLLEIKRGEWTLQQVESEANRLFKLAEEAYVKSKLPDAPNFRAINKLCVKILTSYFFQGFTFFAQGGVK